jgi:hypothetical protein
LTIIDRANKLQCGLNRSPVKRPYKNSATVFIAGGKQQFLSYENQMLAREISFATRPRRISFFADIHYEY